MIDLTKASCFKLSTVVDARDPTTGTTPLLAAAERGDAGIAKILLGRGADVHATDNLTRTAAHIGALHNHAQFLDLIVLYGANLEATTKEGLTPLMLAIEQQQLREKESTRAEGIRFLLEKNVNIKDRTAGEGHTPFLRAVALHRLAVVKVFLTATKGGGGGGKKGGKESVVGVGVRVLGVDEDRDLEGRTGFMLAVAGSDLVMAELLLELGADIETKDKEGKTALMRVVEQAGKEGGKEKEKEVVEFLLKHEASLKASVKESGFTPLLLAAMQGNKTMVELLLANGADVEEEDSKDYTPLMHAAEKGHTDLVKYLMEKGAPVITIAKPTSVTARRSNSKSWMDRSLSLGSQSGASSLNAATSNTAAAAATAAALQLPTSTPLSRVRLSASIHSLGQSLGQSGQGQTPRKLTAEDVAATEEIKSLVRRALNCGPPVLPQAPEVRKEKLDPSHPSIILAFAPPVPTAATPKLGALKYGAECFVVKGEGEEMEGEEGMEEKPVAVLEGLSSGQTPFVFRGLERSRWYVFKVYAEAVGGRGMASTSEPIFLATAPNGAPSVREVLVEEQEGREGQGGVEGIMEEETEMVKGGEEVEEEGQEGVEEGGESNVSSVRVIVDEPTDDGGAPITSYVLTAKPGSFKVESQTTTLLLPGLVKGKSYKISVAAKNAVGQGPFSRVVSHDVAL